MVVKRGAPLRTAIEEVKRISRSGRQPVLRPAVSYDPELQGSPGSRVALESPPCGTREREKGHTEARARAARPDVWRVWRWMLRSWAFSRAPQLRADSPGPNGAETPLRAPPGPLKRK